MFNTWGTTSAIYDNGTNIAQLSVPSTVSGLRCDIEVYNGSTLNNIVFKPMIRYADVQNANFVPYETSTLSLSISDKFPDGMDGVGTAFDEQTPTDYYKRIGMVDMSALPWSAGSRNLADTGNIFYLTKPVIKNSNVISAKFTYKDSALSWESLNPNEMTFAGNSLSNWYFVICTTDANVASLVSSLSGVFLYYELSTPLHNYGVVDLGTKSYSKSASGLFRFNLTDSKNPATNDIVGNIVCSLYLPVKSAGFAGPEGSTPSPNMLMALSKDGVVYFNNTSYSSTSDFKTAMSGVYLYYEKSNPESINLDLTYPIWDNGTEQLLPENTSVPVTTPILCDIDYRTMIPVNADDDPDGSGVITGTGNYRYHSMATLTATPTDEIYRFLRWEDENGDTVSTNSTYTFEVGE